NLITVTGDKRITRVGSLLRKTKLDELPQFVNVVAGDMSLVGPRPEVPRYVAMYPPEVKRVVLSVRPGITGDASVEFRNESASLRNESDLLADAADPEAAYSGQVLPRKLDLYVNYVTTRTFVGDLAILFRTFWTIVRD